MAASRFPWRTSTGKPSRRRQNFDLGAGLGDAGGADEHHLQRASGQGSGFGENRGIDLAAVGVALHHGVEGAQAALRGMAHFASQQNAPAQVPKTGRAAVNSLSDSNSPRRSRNFSMVVDSPPGRMRPSRLAVEFLGITDLRQGSAPDSRQGFGVGGVIALDGEHADAGVVGLQSTSLRRNTDGGVG